MAECSGTTYHVSQIQGSDKTIDALILKLQDKQRFPHYICADAYLELLTPDTRNEPKFVAWAETRGRLESIATFTVGFGKTRYIHIDYLCSAQPKDRPSERCKHVTTRLLAYIHNMAALAGAGEITLSSTREAAKFYRTIGMTPAEISEYTFYHNDSHRNTRIHASRARRNAQVSPTNARAQRAIEKIRRSFL